MRRRRLDTSRAAHKGGSSLPNQEVITGEAESLLLEAEADNTLAVQGEISDLCVSVALKTNSKSTRKKKETVAVLFLLLFLLRCHLKSMFVKRQSTFL